ncbi:transglutaminase-like domain-containing protein [Ramlibacter sp.]|uniref:transglutaminase-like domain-containing protein n=1 Tax=Ramlibacter sp. TaxID=1917967 RepID=UPI003D13E8EE
MKIDRRHFIAAGAASGLGLPGLAFAQAAGTPAVPAGASKPFDATWRTFDVTTRVNLKRADAPSQLWLPLPSVDGEWQTPMVESFISNGKARVTADPRTGVRMLHVQFPDSREPMAEVTSRVRTRSRPDAMTTRPLQRDDAASLRKWLAPTEMIPTDGIVRTTAQKAVGTARTDVDKARAIYDWVVNNAHREPKTRGCGEGNVKAMLESGDLSGKCVDLNSLFVGLCRSVGLPARDMYGLRLAPSATGYRELGANPQRLDGAQHCRAEVYLQAHGWVPVDPADVAKVMRQETPQWIKSAKHPLITPVYARLFGTWEGNWLAWNDAHDVHLPGAKSKTISFLMYPVAEIGGERIDSYSPADFAYSIAAKEVTA